LGGFGVEELLVKVDGLVDVRDVQGKLHTGGGGEGIRTHGLYIANVWLSVF
jgi:hypothetical protein